MTTLKMSPQDVLDSMRSEIGADAFAAQYQQQPIPPGGVLVKRDWIKRYERLPIGAAGAYIIQSWDSALGSGENNSFSVCITLLVHDNIPYLADVVRTRLDYRDLKAKAIDLAKRDKPRQIVVEDAGFGRALVDDLKAAGFAAMAMRPEGNKVTRLLAQLGKIESLLRLPMEAPWLADFEAEIFAFPNTAHDDQVDALSQALAQPTHETYLWSDKATENLNNALAAIAFQNFIRTYG
jgi:predicted phage terminase large subunit-like protein